MSDIDQRFNNLSLYDLTLDPIIKNRDDDKNDERYQFVREVFIIADDNDLSPDAIQTAIAIGDHHSHLQLNNLIDLTPTKLAHLCCVISCKFHEELYEFSSCLSVIANEIRPFEIPLLKSLNFCIPYKHFTWCVGTLSIISREIQSRYALGPLLDLLIKRIAYSEKLSNANPITILIAICLLWKRSAKFRSLAKMRRYAKFAANIWVKTGSVYEVSVVLNTFSKVLRGESVNK